MNTVVPHLRSGAGHKPENGGCILQIIDWVHTGGWSDNPECVHPVLRRLAIKANDSMGDLERQRLLDLAPRLMNTNTGGEELSVRLAIFCAEHVLPHYEDRFPGDARPRNAILAAKTWCDNPDAAIAYAAAYAAADAADAIANANAAIANTNTAAYAAAYAAADAANAATYAAYTAAAAAANANANANAAAAAAYAADTTDAFAAAPTPYQLLLLLLDEYDHITHRTTTPPLDYTPVTCMLKATGKEGLVATRGE